MSEKGLAGVGHLERSIDWKQGLAIALGVPLLILPSLGYIPLYLSAAAILIWGLSVLQGFMQNTAYAEMATTFPEASGLPGYAQHIFRTENYQGKYDKGKLIGGFSAWSYWFAWNPVLRTPVTARQAVTKSLEFQPFWSMALPWSEYFAR